MWALNTPGEDFEQCNKVRNVWPTSNLCASMFEFPRRLDRHKRARGRSRSPLNVRTYTAKTGQDEYSVGGVTTELQH